MQFPHPLHSISVLMSFTCSGSNVVIVHQLATHDRRQSANNKWKMEMLPASLGHTATVYSKSDIVCPGWQVRRINFQSPPAVCPLLSCSQHNTKNALYGSFSSANSKVWSSIILHIIDAPCINMINSRTGPLILTWCMRMEGKNAVSKQAARTSNFKNVPFTVAKRHQRLLCMHLQSKTFFDYETVYGPGKHVACYSNS